MPWSEINNNREQPNEQAAPRMVGQWLCLRSNTGPRKAVMMHAANGNAGTSQSRVAGSDITVLPLLRRRDAGWRQMRQRFLSRQLGHRLIEIEDRLLAWLTQLLPEAH